MAYYNIGTIVEMLRNRLNPLVGNWCAVAVGSNDDVVLCRLDTHHDSQFLARLIARIVRRVGETQIRCLLHHIFEKSVSGFVCTIVHDDYFVVRIVLRKEIVKVVRQVFGVVICIDDD